MKKKRETVPAGPQPFSTRPQTGEYFLAWGDGCGGDEELEGQQHPEMWVPMAVVDLGLDSKPYRRCMVEVDEVGVQRWGGAVGAFTHWMPMPPAPERK